MQKLSPFALGINANIKAELARRDIADEVVRTELDLGVDALRRRKAGRIAWTLDEIQAVGELVRVDPSTLTTVPLVAISRQGYSGATEVQFVERHEAGSTPA